MNKSDAVSLIKRQVAKAVLSRKNFIIAANWKMNKNAKESADFIKALGGAAINPKDTVILFPPSPYLYIMRDCLRFSRVLYGTQNLYYESAGAFTGEISPDMAEDLGCKYAIIGHSERRNIFGETDDLLNKKVAACIKCGMKAVLCIGENLAERNSGRYMEKLKRQIDLGLAGLPADQLGSLVIAYEPIWAIGTGVNATPDQVEETHCCLRSVLISLYGAPAGGIPLLYGGSVKSGNVAELGLAENVSGFLIGGASLKADEFGKIIRLLSGE